MFIEDEKDCRVRYPCHCTGKYIGAAYRICNLLVFHSDSNYVYLFIMKKPAEEFEGQIDCLEENAEKCITLGPVKENGNGKAVTYKIKLTDSGRFMASSLLRITDSLTKILCKNKCQKCESGLDYVTAKDRTLTFKCVDCKSYEKQFYEGFIQKRMLVL